MMLRYNKASYGQVFAKSSLILHFVNFMMPLQWVAVTENV